ncbi:hypothetical protein KAFR_0B01050 [Kazachstania africana CBS 2517]|uniref:BPL/LPL catalytic domain-containing protein n=1 Tax=Kazachstania africana (strain ATCC 22294 / BCRC 22015 / CBS 2517 / CECT 1963 / NBRC 1671 / NRRL Y-8276) TaxID=1071382 RepID=H2APV3_KAZAF|nr:hypothetical protein KAFR_0B01050 [Kazachstania africana CBS 2517]CCF56403.1 hypothetical protein KAFR_0B01050 [Kazachstania africana CBS 2517]
MNILVYNGPGTTPGSVRHAVETFRQFLEPYYAINVASPKVLETEPWITKTAAIVFPGGADLPYVRECRPFMNKIRDYIYKSGGLYIGFCAGGYFGSKRVEFCQGIPNMEVTGGRDLQFFPGIARGPAYGTYKYNSEEGACAAKLLVNNGNVVYNYFNGGAVFVDADKCDNVEVLAHYSDSTSVSFSDSVPFHGKPAAVVLCEVGRGKALLTGAHPEFTPKIMEQSQESGHLSQAILQVLKDNDKQRLQFLQYIFSKAGLHCNDSFGENKRPDLTPLLVCSRDKSKVDTFKDMIVQNMKDLVEVDGRSETSGESNTFKFYEGFNSQYAVVTNSLRGIDPENAPVSIIFPSVDEGLPDKSFISHFDVQKYFKHLHSQNSLGSLLLYGDVVTSTSSMLNQNHSFVKSMPDNSVLHVGTIQVLGKGRGGNAWVNPRGVSASTAVVSVPTQSPTTGKPVPFVFVQYIAMLAYCEAIFSYGDGYEDLPIRIKWPNDLYALDPKYYHNNKMTLLGGGLNSHAVPLQEREPAFCKISGLLVNTFFDIDKYILLLGCGLNVDNNGPTTSLNGWVRLLNQERENAHLQPLPPIEIEVLQALCMNRLQSLLKKFIDCGAEAVLPEYYKFWLHSNQVVKLSEHGNVLAKITGITEDYGLLIAKELVMGGDSEFTGTIYHLQPDGNTFDIFKGLIARKV